MFFSFPGQCIHLNIDLHLDSILDIKPFMADFSLKLVLNIVSSGAHVLKGQACVVLIRYNIAYIFNMAFVGLFVSIVLHL